MAFNPNYTPIVMRPSVLAVPMKFADGTAGAPSITFASETTLGWYRSAPGVLTLDGGTLTLGAATAVSAKPLTISGNGDARVAYIETSQAADNTRWLLGPSGLNFLGKTLDDANNVSRNWLAVLRSGTNISSITFSTGAGVSRWQIDSSGHLLSVTDNTYDIGAYGATRARDFYLANKMQLGPSSSNPTVATLNHLFVADGVVASQSGGGGEINFGYNFYYNAGFKYRHASGAAGKIGFGTVATGAWSVQTAASGTADAAITWAENLRVASTGVVVPNALVLGNTSIASSNTVYSIVKTVGSIADNSATTVFTVTVPNANHAASIKLRFMSWNGSTDGHESTRTAEGTVVLARTTGVATVVSTVAISDAAIATVAAGATHTLAYSVTAVSGAVGATQTFDIQVTIDDSGNVGSNSVTVLAELINAENSGVTIA